MLDEQQQARVVVHDLQRELAERRELEESASAVNNLLRQRLEEWKAKGDKARAATVVAEERAVAAEERAVAAAAGDEVPLSAPSEVPQTYAGTSVRGCEEDD